jgi:phage terminase small subunit
MEGGGRARRLTEQQRHFCRNLAVKGMSAIDAAREAEYRNPSVSANELLSSPVVQEYLEQLREKSESETVATKLQCEEKLTNQITTCDRPQDVREAIKLLAHMRGWLVTKHEVKGKLEFAAAEMSDAEVTERLRKIQAGEE